MITIETLFSETRRVAAQVDWDTFPETSDYFDTILRECELLEDEPYQIASALIDCDKPKHLPPFLIDYITDLYLMEIEDGNHYAMNDLGAQYYDGSRGFEQSFEKAMYYYKLAAAHGDRQAQENLGYCYYYGRNMPAPDYEKAFQYFALGAFDGHLNSLYKIGDMYLNGYYVEKNEQEAFILYNHCLQTMTDEAAKYVSGPVHLRLGDMYLKGQGTAPNPEEALAHYHIAEIMLYKMVKDGTYMYKKSLRRAIDGQERARAALQEWLPEEEWRFE